MRTPAPFCRLADAQPLLPRGGRVHTSLEPQPPSPSGFFFFAQPFLAVCVPPVRVRRTMGRAKRTRKYAATKRVLNPNDGRLKLKAAAKADAAPIVHRDSDKKKGAADALVQRSELFFSHNRALGPPFHVRFGGGGALGGGKGWRRGAGCGGADWGECWLASLCTGSLAGAAVGVARVTGPNLFGMWAPLRRRRMVAVWSLDSLLTHWHFLCPWFGFDRDGLCWCHVAPWRSGLFSCSCCYNLSARTPHALLLTSAPSPFPHLAHRCCWTPTS